MKYSLCVGLLFFALKSNGQIKEEITLNVQSIKIQQGLPNNNVNFCFQDKTGFIWIGTWTGLSKYNGYQFTHFFPNPNKADAIKVGHYISYLKISDSIYFLTTKLDGIQKLNVFTNQITRIKNSPNSPKTITQDNDGTFWIGTLADGFYHYMPHNNSFEHILFKPLAKDFGTNWNNNTVNSIAIDKKNDRNLWLGCRHGLVKYNKLSKHFYPYSITNSSSMHQFSLNNISSILLDNEGNIWAGKFFGGLGKLTIKTGQWEHFYYHPEAFKLKVLNTNIVGNLKFLNANTLSVSTSSGPMHFDIQSKTFTKFNLVNQDNKIVGDVIDYFIDKDNNQWFSNTYQNGIGVASKRLNSTKKIEFPKQYFMPDYYGSVIVDMFWSERYNRYFIVNTNHDGLLSYSKDFKLLDQITIPNNWQDKEPFPTAVAEDDNGNIWLTDITNQLIIYNPLTKKINNYYAKDFKTCSNILRGINNELYFQTEKGLYSYKNNIWQLVIESSKIDLVSNINAEIIYFIEGLDIYTFNVSKNIKTKLFTLPKFATEKGNYIQQIFKDKNHRLWIPLEFGGVYQFDLIGNKNKLMSFEDGLNNNSTREVKEDKNGKIFVICNGGLYYFNEEKKIFIDFDNLTHQKTNDWYEHGLFFTQNDELLVTKDNAFYIIDKNTVLKENNNLPVITDLYSQETHFIYGFNNIQIPNNQNDVKILFSNFDFASANEVIYEYQLEKINTNWIRLDKGINQISFANLSEGNYHFKVRLLGSKNHSSCYFTITAIWYKSKWFYIVSVCLLLGILIFVLNYFYTKKSKEKDLEKRVAELKLTALQSQLNPHFLFNCLTSISGLIKTKEYAKSEIILNDFAKLMRAILSNSSKDLIPLEEEINISKLYLDIEKIRKNNMFDYQLKINELVNTNTLVPPLILQPFLENSIKHGFGLKTNDNIGLITVEINQNSKQLEIKIIDNGIGVVEHKNTFNAHQSMGIEIQKERMLQYAKTHSLNIDIQTEFVKHKGATICIKIV